MVPNKHIRDSHQAFGLVEFSQSCRADTFFKSLRDMWLHGTNSFREIPMSVSVSPGHTEVVPVSQARSVARCLVHLRENYDRRTGSSNTCGFLVWTFPKGSPIANEEGQN